ncbi:MAG: hypothetical protein CV087_16645 [Candidatus Brocadia sp. WS118]|nr:MAG: hypothetical protein CV087_16645 [Candidatus Brocadia sp. WS118]
MAKRKPKKLWVYNPPKPAKPKVPEAIKIEVEKECNELVETVLKLKHIQPPPKDNQFNYLVDIYTKWYRNYFYFYAKYHSPGPYSIAPYFETGFARLEYAGNSKFNLSYMRHTNQWWEIYQGLTLQECILAVKDEPHFIP